MNYPKATSVTKLIAVLLALLPGLLAAHADEPINLAGVYEGNVKKNGLRKQIYLTLDFINGTPDFTQVFTGKEATFKTLPADFMNAKKLNRAFAGTSAPGFGKYKSKILISNSDEFKIFNPHVDNGVIFAEWVSASGSKGQCVIIVNPDRSLQILGLTNFSRDISPDDMMLTLVEDRLPGGSDPYITPTAMAAFTIGEYQKNLVKPSVESIADDISMEVVNAVQQGNQVVINMRAKNMTNYDNLKLLPYPGALPEGVAVAQNGTKYTSFSTDYPGKTGKSTEVPMKKGKWSDFQIIINNVNERVDYFSLVKVECRCAGILPPRTFIVIENLPVLQNVPDELRQGNNSADISDPTPGEGNPIVIPAGKFVKISKDNVNLRSKPTSTASVENQGMKGQFLLLLGEENGWYKVEDLVSGNPVYVSASVASIVKTVPVEVAINDEWTEIEFRNHTLNTNPTSGFESNAKLVFSGSADNTVVDYIGHVDYMTGRMIDIDKRYRGKTLDGYVNLTEEDEAINDHWTPLYMPIKVFGGEKPHTVVYDGVVYEKYQYNAPEWEKVQ